jgi:hypothetical protein
MTCLVTLTFKIVRSIGVVSDFEMSDEGQFLNILDALGGSLQWLSACKCCVAVNSNRDALEVTVVFIVKSGVIKSRP